MYRVQHVATGRARYTVVSNLHSQECLEDANMPLLC